MTVRALKGAPASIILAMLLMPEQVGVGTMELTTMTGYGKDAVRRGLRTLETIGMVQKIGRYNGWVLTAQARQLVLGEAHLLKDGAAADNALPCEAEGAENALDPTSVATEHPDRHHPSRREDAENALPPEAPPTELREGAENALDPADVTTKPPDGHHSSHQEGAKNALPQTCVATRPPDRHHPSRREGAENALAPEKRPPERREGAENALPDPTCTCSSCGSSSSSLDSRTTTTTTCTTCEDEDAKNALPPETPPKRPPRTRQARGKKRTRGSKRALSPPWAEVVETMVQRCGTPQRYARQAIAAAIARGESPPFTKWCIVRWLEYCYDEHNRSIKNPAIFISRKIEAGQQCPDRFEVRPYSEVWHELRALRRAWDVDSAPDPEPAASPGKPDVAPPSDSKAGQIWDQALDDLKLQMTRATFDTWLHDSEALSIQHEGNGAATSVLTVAVKNSYAVEWLENRLYAMIQRTLARITEKPWELRFVERGCPSASG